MTTNIECHPLYTNSALTNYVKNKWIKIKIKNAEESSMFQISAQAKYTYFHERLQYSSIKKYMTLINIKNTHFLSINISGFRKQRPDIVMSNNYVLLVRFL